MPNTNYTYSILEVSRDQVLSKINLYGYEMHAVKIDDGTHINVSRDISVGELKEMVSTTDYLYFYIKAKEEKSKSED